MNIEQAKRIPLADILNKLDCALLQQEQDKFHYQSPLNEENTRRIVVDPYKNTWSDEADKMHGDPIALICLYLQRNGHSHTVQDALRWLSNMMGYAARIEPIHTPVEIKKTPKLKKLDVQALSEPALIHYLESRGISFDLAGKYLKQVRVENKESGKKSTLIGFRNEDGGYVLRSRSFEGSIGKEYLTFIRGNIVKPSGIHIFKDFIDYLSALLQHNDGNNFDDDAIILNSWSFLSHATPFIKGYGYAAAYSWMDNDVAGIAATRSMRAFFKTEENLGQYPMNRLYTGHRDVNAWHTTRS